MTIWGPVTIGAAAAGLWWALRQTGKLPTVRMVLGLIIGWGLATAIGTWVEAGFRWVQRTANHLLPGGWSLLVPAIPVALFFATLGLFLHGIHSKKEAPDRRAEYLAMAFCTLALFVAGAGSELMQAINSIGHGAGGVASHVAGMQIGGRP